MPTLTTADPTLASLAFRLPPFPEVARKLLAEVDGDQSDFVAVARLIRSDAVFSAEVLRLANSALFARRFEVASILHAISVLGIRRLKALVMTVGLREFVSFGASSPSIRRCWRHNLSAALIAEALAGACGLNCSEAYTAGLLHGIGHVALIATDKDLYEQVVEAAREHPDAFLEIELSHFGFNHAEAARYLVERWQLPPVFGEICRCDHSHKGIDPTHLAGIAEYSCELAGALGFPVVPGGGRDPESCFDELQLRLPERLRERFTALIPAIAETIPFKLNLFEQEFFH